MNLATLLPDYLRGHPVGREILTAAQASEARLDERKGAVSRIREAEKLREQLPALAKVVAVARTRLETETERLATKLHEATVAHDSAASSASHLYSRAENVLRYTACRLVHSAGPVVSAIEAAREHIRAKHLLGINSEIVRREAAFDPETPAPEDVEPVERLRKRVRDADEAGELMGALEWALAELLDLQLEVEVSGAAIREIVDACPEACICGLEFKLEQAVREAAEADGVTVPDSTTNGAAA